MRYNRLENTGRNLVWGSVETLTGIILPFFVRTALIHALSMEYVGLGGLFSSILQLLSLTELGIASAITHSLYHPLATDDTDTVCALLAFYRNAYRIIGTIVIVIGLAFLPFLDHLIKGSYPDDIRLQSVYAIYLINNVLSYFVFADKKTLLIALQRNDVTNKVTACIKVVSCCLQIIVLLTVQNYYLYVFLLPLSTLADNLLCAWRAKKMYPQFVCKGHLPSSQKAAITKKTKGLLMHRLCGSTRNACDSLFLSTLFGLSTVGIYNNYFYIMNSVRSLLNVITKSMSGGVGNTVAVDNIERNHQNLLVLTFLYEWICGFCTVSLLCLYQPFMKLWVGESALFSMDVVISLCIYFYVWTLGDIKSQFADARGIWWKDRYRAGAEALCNLILNFVMVRFFGVTGIVLATAVSILFLGFPWSTRILFDDYFGRKHLLHYWLIQLLYAAATLFACLLTYYTCSLVTVDGLFGLILRGILCCVVPNAFYLICYCRTQIFRQSIPYVLRLLRKRP